MREKNKIMLYKPWMIWPQDLQRGRYKLFMNHDLTLEGWRRGRKDSSNESYFALYFTDEEKFMEWEYVEQN